MRYVNVSQKALDEEEIKFKKWLDETEKIIYRLKNSTSENEINNIIEEHEKHLKKDIYFLKKWLEKAEKITEQLKNATSENERNSIIDKYEKHLKKDIYPLKKWLEKAQEITEQLKNATSENERKTIIEENEEHWRDEIFRNWLIAQFYGKCWYSEAKESVSFYHVDHFRPKGRVKDINGLYREGYWWLAFEWTNYRISGQFINVQKRDMFPLLCGDPAKPFDDYSLEIESPLLLDPCIKTEASLISFNESGEATYVKGIDDQDKLRANQTIDILGLNERKCLVENRLAKWNECKEEILTYTNAPKNPILKKVYKALAVNKLKKMIKEQEEFSSVALACIIKTTSESLYKEIFI